MKHLVLALALGSTLWCAAPVWPTTGGDASSGDAIQPGPFGGPSREAWDAYLVKTAKIALVSAVCTRTDEHALSPFARYCHLGGSHVSLRTAATRY